MSRGLQTIAPSKVNVCLLLGPTRADGRHELVTVFQALDLADDVHLLETLDVRDDEVVCDPPVEGENLALRAIRAFRAATGWNGPPVRVTITKRIPVAGGMAGGSSDAAATLRLLATHAAPHLGRTGRTVPDADDLRAIAATLGADVPALVEPGRWLGTAAGERVERLPLLADGRTAYVVVTSPTGLSTPDVFREADRLGLPRSSSQLALGGRDVRARAGDLPRVLCVNELEPAALSLRPDLRDTLAALRAVGAEVAMVSGSGPTCVGLYDNPARARQAAPVLAERFGAEHVRLAGALPREQVAALELPRVAGA
ncbi:4-(cytidine 5'-diphospho)-2-C-methyl-D-erythritol kinase [Conexibacter sp. W3-3-2]|uniref:4-(cytidine 5'-diphospho)-2-C-methyl-D-erythritol kinase n=1 Tax=Conexibacter sp. W3-3-2 TaxID=2675227 RepID=UPI0012B9791D|nr:4-(cytidine 5'-diphospho)-2-C-methyl-D-erythritol kinase [Conexibacter sp. W3-3-2]MTD46540.1 4-(cytidine 5'-diphospho)-2-C-methyl-D-erythritol kinase [Conexibacter sp. W3-3-2]